MSLNNRKPSVFTTAAFLYAGLTSFTKQAFERAAKAFDVKATQKKLDGQVFLVTGANSGIGKATTRDLLERGGTVHMACRSPDKAFRAREELLKDTGADPSKCLVHILDLSSVRQVKAFARHFARGVCGGRLDCLINNAGCMVHKREINDEGNEINFATNTLGTFVLTEELLPVLAKPDRQLTPSRVVTVSSGGAYNQKLDVDDFQTKSGFDDGSYIYAQNKRQQIALTEAWARKQASQQSAGNSEVKKARPVSFQVMHPGWVDTPAVRNSLPDFHRRMKGRLRTEEQGADTVIWLATAEEALREDPGGFYLDRKAQPKFLWGTFTSNTEKESDALFNSLKTMSSSIEPSAEHSNKYGYMQSAESLKNVATPVIQTKR